MAFRSDRGYVYRTLLDVTVPPTDGSDKTHYGERLLHVWSLAQEEGFELPASTKTLLAKKLRDAGREVPFEEEADKAKN